MCRDVFVVFDQRLALMLAEDDPLFASWDQDATALESRYELQDPGEGGGRAACRRRDLGSSFRGGLG